MVMVTPSDGYDRRASSAFLYQESFCSASFFVQKFSSPFVHVNRTFVISHSVITVIERYLYEYKVHIHIFDREKKRGGVNELYTYISIIYLITNMLQCCRGRTIIGYNIISDPDVLLFRWLTKVLCYENNCEWLDFVAIQQVSISRLQNFDVLGVLIYWWT